MSFPSLDLISICNFITHAHSVLNIRASTIQTYLAGINFFHKLAAGSPCPAASHSHINMLVKGLRKQEPAPSTRHLPLTADLLSLRIHTLRSGYSSPMVDLTLKSMFPLAFFGVPDMLRICPNFFCLQPFLSSQYVRHNHPYL